MPTLAIEYAPLTELVAHERNPKAHDVELVARSIARFGFADPVVIDERTGKLAAGHGRLAALTRLRDDDADPPEGIEVDDAGEWLVPRVVGWRSASDSEAEAALIALNRTTEVGGWDEPALLELLEDLAALDDGLDGIGYGSEDLAELRARLDELDEDIADPPPPDPAPWPHRATGDAKVEVIHGDAFEVLAGLEADSIDSLVTDPPYGLEFMGKGWDSFREAAGVDRNPRWAGDRTGTSGGAELDTAPEAKSKHGRVTYGGHRPTTRRCRTCGKRDAFQNPHSCDEDGTADWVTEPVDPHAAPPGMLAFGEWVRQWALHALRVVKPGGHLIAFGGSRTHHRLMAGLEDAGWEIRDCGVWLYRTGFPKSLDVGKALDARAGAERPVVGIAEHTRKGPPDESTSGSWAEPAVAPVTAPATPEAAEWDGWGTALKPAIEPWVLARRPITERNIAENVLRYGTGALNVDACRAPAEDGGRPTLVNYSGPSAGVYGDGLTGSAADGLTDEGRWPANVVTLEDDEDLRFFRAAVGAVADYSKASTAEKPWDTGNASIAQARCRHCGLPALRRCDCPTPKWEHADAGSALSGYICEAGHRQQFGSATCNRCGAPVTHHEGVGDHLHPTVKPLALMAHLIRLVTPPGGTVLDPFAGTGTTGEAALIEGVNAVLIEREPCGECDPSCPDYLSLIHRRVARTAGEDDADAATESAAESAAEVLAEADE